MSWEQVARKKVDYTPDAGNSPGTPEYINGPTINVFAGTGSAAALAYMAGIESSFVRPAGAQPTASLSDSYGLLTDDDIDARRAAQAAMPPEEAEIVALNDSNVVLEEDTTTPEPPPAAVPANCAALPNTMTFSPSLQLSANFTYGQLSSLAKAGSHAIDGNGPRFSGGLKNGLTPQQILCNLKTLCDNVLEPLAAKYGRRNIQINSGYRNNGGSSQHEKGQAADLRFLDLPGGVGNSAQQAYYDRAVEIRKLFGYDQLILETFGKQGPWIHVSWSASSQRRMALSCHAFNGPYLPGISRRA